MSVINKAKAARKFARAALRKEGKPVPKLLNKGGLKKMMGKPMEKAPTTRKAANPRASKAIMAKLEHTRKLRSKVRQALTKNGNAIPSSLKKGVLKNAMNKMPKRSEDHALARVFKQGTDLGESRSKGKGTKKAKDKLDKSVVKFVKDKKLATKDAEMNAAEMKNDEKEAAVMERKADLSILKRPAMKQVPTLAQRNAAAERRTLKKNKTNQ